MINLMGQIGIFVRCGGWCYLVITLVTSSITGRHWGVSLTTRDTRDLQLCALCSVLTPDMFCSKPGQVSMTVGARGRAGYIPSQYNTKTKSSPGGILPVPVKTKKSISRPDLVITSRRSQNSAQISSLGNVKANVIYHGHDQSELQASDACLPLLNTDLGYVTVPS